MDATLKQIGEYITWSEKILIDLLKDVKDEDFVKVNPNFGRSIKDLANHIWLSYKGYFLGFSQELENLGKESKEFSKQEVLQTWLKNTKEFSDAIQKEGETFLYPVSEERKVEISMVSNMIQYSDHASYHRGQLITLLKLAGYEVKSTDYYLFLTEYLNK